MKIQEVHKYNSDILFHFYHAHPGLTHSEDNLKDVVFSPDECIGKQSDSHTVNKCRFKFGNLQIFSYISNEQSKDGSWDTIPRYCKNTILKCMRELNIKITRLKNKCISQLFKYF